MNNYLRRVRPANNVGDDFLKLPLEDKKYIKDIILNCNLAIEFDQPYQNILYIAKKDKEGVMKKVIETLSKMKKDEFEKLIHLI